jgi:hypothetical protein
MPYNNKRFRVGDIVCLKYPVVREDRSEVEAGVLLSILAITPKVRICSDEHIDDIDLIYRDTYPYFFNAIPFGEKDQNRIRESFIVLDKDFNNKKGYRRG